MRRPIPAQASRFLSQAAAKSPARRRRTPPDSVVVRVAPADSAAVEACPADLGAAVVEASVVQASADAVALGAQVVAAAALRKRGSSATADSRTAFTAWCSLI